MLDMPAILPYLASRFSEEKVAHHLAFFLELGRFLLECEAAAYRWQYQSDEIEASVKHLREQQQCGLRLMEIMKHVNPRMVCLCFVLFEYNGGRGS